MKRSDQIHILVADNEKDLCFIVGFVLQREGYIVSTAANGREALEIILKASKTENPIELLIADMMMPEIDGLELIDNIQRAGGELPVLAISGTTDRDILGKLLQRGHEYYLEKPFDCTLLLNSIRGILETTQKKKHKAASFDLAPYSTGKSIDL